MIKLDNTTGGQIKCITSNEIISFRFNEIMKDNFQISKGDLLEFSLAINQNNGVCFSWNFLEMNFSILLGFTTCNSNKIIIKRRFISRFTIKWNYS